MIEEEMTFMNNDHYSFRQNEKSSTHNSSIQNPISLICLKPKNFKIHITNDKIKSIDWYKKNLEQPVRRIVNQECSRRKK
jgi:hypothetical protein